MHDTVARFDYYGKRVRLSAAELNTLNQILFADPLKLGDQPPPPDLVLQAATRTGIDLSDQTSTWLVDGVVNPAYRAPFMGPSQFKIQELLGLRRLSRASQGILDYCKLAVALTDSHPLAALSLAGNAKLATEWLARRYLMLGAVDTGWAKGVLLKIDPESFDAGTAKIYARLGDPLPLQSAKHYPISYSFNSALDLIHGSPLGRTALAKKLCGVVGLGMADSSIDWDLVTALSEGLGEHTETVQACFGAVLTAPSRGSTRAALSVVAGSPVGARDYVLRQCQIALDGTTELLSARGDTTDDGAVKRVDSAIVVLVSLWRCAAVLDEIL